MDRSPDTPLDAPEEPAAGPDAEPESGPDAGTAARSRGRALTAAIAVCLVVVAALLVFFRSSTPGDASPEAGFARDMSVHHAQAVEMAFAIRDAGTDPTIRGIAYDIIVTQTAQRGMFMGWLQQWGLDQGSDRPPMAWMTEHTGHDGATTPAPGTAGGRMPGMATGDELRRLKAAKGEQAEILFLQLMIRHHEGGVEMALAVLPLTDRPEVRTMAQGIIDTQKSEIALMTELLKRRGAQPYPSILE